jgi:DNA-binding SARP family transcriptional activator/tetratricopeptide (TPR) repeat protein/DNA-binding XRE family transcriptional regulator
VDRGSASFGDALRAGRIRAGLTQHELATRAGVSVRAVRYIEQGRVARPRRESMRRLAEAVGLDGNGDWPVERPDERLRIGVLGRLDLRGDGQPVDMGPLKQRSLLALLALQPNRVVHREEIVDVLWGNRPPESVQNLVHTYISRLRKAAVSRLGSDVVLISSARGGYRLSVDVAQLDLLQFDEHSKRAGQLRLTEPESALAIYEQALRLWRGPVLEDLPAEIRQHPAALAAAARRLATALAFADTALALGRYQPAVEQLRALVHDEPLHEGLHSRLMLGLAGSGQQAAALRLFGEIRDRLADDLGIEPGAEIVAAHMRIIRNEVTATPSPPRLAIGHPTPAQLPADIGGFTGRDEHLDRLDAVLHKRTSGRNTGVTICAIGGSAGVGKTALAVHWAHRVRDQFPDGQLYVNLRGYASASPVRPVEALTRFLHALGLPSERVPLDEEEAVGLYRTMLADRRALILLDNASGTDQVRPLLPGSPGCLVLITSRDRLAGLAVAEGAHRITLDMLDPADAHSLLARMIGDERTDPEPQAVADLAHACAYLPLALRIVAANLASLPHTSLADYTEELRRRGRLNELVVDGDDAGAVRAAFDLSYETLEPQARQLFRLLGLVPGPDFTAEAATALVDGELLESARLLYQLAGAHLVHEHAAGRYQFHDLLKEYAADRAWNEDGAGQVHAATERLFEFYRGASDAATRMLYPHVLRMSPEPSHRVPPASESAAVDWLDAELPNLVAAAKACPPGLARYSWQLADSLRGYFVTRGHGTEGLIMCRVALSAAQQEWDTAAEASINDILGLIHYNLSDYARATSYHSKALALNRRTEDAFAEASSLHNLGRVYSQQGKPTQALLHYEQALTINRRIGNRHGEASDLNYVGAAWLSRGRPDRAIAHHTQALVIARQLGSRSLQVAALNGLGLAHWALGQLDHAVRFHRECLDICGQMGHKVGETTALVCLAETNCDAGRFQEAYVQAQTCIAQGRQLGERRHEVGGIDVLATVHLRRGHPEIAARYYADALQIAREIGFGYGEASVLIGLCSATRKSGQLSESITHGHDALVVLHDSGMRLLEGRALTELAHSYMELGVLDQAVLHAERALKVVRDRKQRLAEARALQVLSLIRKATDDSGTASELHQTALEIFTEIGTQEAYEV